MAPTVTKDRILKTAQRLFYGEGIRATGVDRLIEESGVSKMTFYKYYPSKHDLVVAVLTARDQEWLREFPKKLERHAAEKTESKLLLVFDVLGEWFAEKKFRGCAFLNAVIEACDAGSEEVKIAQLHKENQIRYFESLAKAEGFKKPREVAEQIMMLVDGALVKSVVGGGPEAASMAKAIARRLFVA